MQEIPSSQLSKVCTRKLNPGDVMGLGEVVQKLQGYADYNNNPPTSVAFMPAIASTSGRLHSEFIRLLFLQTHRETDHFFAASGVQPPQSNHGTFHYTRSAFLSQIKSKIDSSLVKAAAIRVNLNIDGTPITSSRILPNFTDRSLVC